MTDQHEPVQPENLPAPPAMATVVNVSDQTAMFQIAVESGRAPRRYRLEPGETLELEVAYARPRLSKFGVVHYLGDDDQSEASSRATVLPAIVEQLTGGRVVPVDDPRAATTRRS